MIGNLLDCPRLSSISTTKKRPYYCFFKVHKDVAKEESKKQEDVRCWETWRKDWRIKHILGKKTKTVGTEAAIKAP